MFSSDLSKSLLCPEKKEPIKNPVINLKTGVTYDKDKPLYPDVINQCTKNIVDYLKEVDPKTISEFPPDFCCPISGEIMENPVLLVPPRNKKKIRYAMTYDETSLLNYCEKNKKKRFIKEPMTGIRIKLKPKKLPTYIANPWVKNNIKCFFESYPHLKPKKTLESVLIGETFSKEIVGQLFLEGATLQDKTDQGDTLFSFLIHNHLEDALNFLMTYFPEKLNSKQLGELLLYCATHEKYELAQLVLKNQYASRETSCSIDDIAKAFFLMVKKDKLPIEAREFIAKLCEQEPIILQRMESKVTAVSILINNSFLPQSQRQLMLNHLVQKHTSYFSAGDAGDLLLVDVATQNYERAKYLLLNKFAIDICQDFFTKKWALHYALSDEKCDETLIQLLTKLFPTGLAQVNHVEQTPIEIALQLKRYPLIDFWLNHYFKYCIQEIVYLFMRDLQQIKYKEIKSFLNSLSPHHANQIVFRACQKKLDSEWSFLETIKMYPSVISLKDNAGLTLLDYAIERGMNYAVKEILTAYPAHLTVENMAKAIHFLIDKNKFDMNHLLLLPSCQIGEMKEEVGSVAEKILLHAIQKIKNLNQAKQFLNSICYNKIALDFIRQPSSPVKEVAQLKTYYYQQEKVSFHWINVIKSLQEKIMLLAKKQNNFVYDKEIECFLKTTISFQPGLFLSSSMSLADEYYALCFPAIPSKRIEVIKNSC